MVKNIRTGQEKNSKKMLGSQRTSHPTNSAGTASNSVASVSNAAKLTQWILSPSAKQKIKILSTHVFP
jgi:hypothetical protein